MTQKIIALQLLTLLVIIAACTQKTEQISTEPSKQPADQAVPEKPADELDALIPQMASGDIKLRENAQKKFETMCHVASRPGAEADRLALCQRITARLGAKSPLDARVWMIRQLEKIGRDESVAPLAKLLHDDEQLIRETARRALQHNSSDSVREAIEQALAEADTPEDHIAYLNVLAARRESQSVPTITAWTSNENAQVAAVALAALGDIGGPIATDTLEKLFRDANYAHRTEAASALLRAAELILEQGDREESARIFDDLYISAGDQATRFAALRGLTQAKGPAAVVTLLEIMQDADPVTRIKAAQLALEIPGEAVTLTLAMMMFETPPAVQATLLEGLGKRGDPTARAAAINGAHGSEPEVRIAAIHALQDLGNSSDVMLLAQLAAGSTGPEQQAARQALARLNTPDVDQTIESAIKQNADPSRRCELIRACGARWYRPAIFTILQVCTDPSPEIQETAFETLGDLAEEQHLPKMVRLLTMTQDESARETAETAVVKVAQRIKTSELRAEPVLKLLGETSSTARASLIRVLGRIGGSRALQAIRYEYPGQDPEVVDAAVRALANWPTTEVLDDLYLIASTSTHQSYPVLALRGYVRLVRLPSDRTPAETFGLLEAAMAIAPGPAEQKLVLGGLAEVPNLDALMLADMLLANDELRDEAALSMISIARGLAAEQPTAALAAIEKVQAAPVGEKVAQQATAACDFINQFAGYCATWRVSGLYKKAGYNANKLFDLAFPPETDGAEWTPLKINNRDNPWIFKLERTFGGSNCCAYVKTSIVSEREQKVRLEIGSDDAVKAWLNGQLVHSNLVARGVTPGDDKVEIKLNEGANALMLKIVQGGGGWGFTAGIKALDGNIAEGITFSAE